MRLAPALAARECAVIFKGKTIEKGVAFPTCVSINQCVDFWMWCLIAQRRQQQQQ